MPNKKHHMYHTRRRMALSSDRQLVVATTPPRPLLLQAAEEEEESSPSSQALVLAGSQSQQSMVVRNPTMLNRQLQQAVMCAEDEAMPENTMKAFLPKQNEFYQFCDYQYPSQSTGGIRDGTTFNYGLNAEKAHLFMYYQSFRPQRKRGGKRNEATTFDPDTYEAVVQHHKNNLGGYPPDPEKPIGHSTFNTYKAMLKRLHKVQLVNNVNNLTWGEIWQIPLEVLCRTAQHKYAIGRRKGRKKPSARRNN